MSAALKTAVMNTRSLARRIADFIGAFAGDCGGVSAVEFALLLPMMMTLFLGSVEASQGIAANRKITLATHTLADLASQYTDITNADMSNIWPPVRQFSTLSDGEMQEVVSEISIDAQGQPTVVWSDTLNGSALRSGKSSACRRRSRCPTAIWCCRRCSTITIRPTATC